MSIICVQKYLYLSVTSNKTVKYSPKNRKTLQKAILKLQLFNFKYSMNIKIYETGELFCLAK